MDWLIAVRVSRHVSSEMLVLSDQPPSATLPWAEAFQVVKAGDLAIDGQK